VTSGRLARADFEASGVAPVAVWSTLRDHDSAAPAAARTALALGGKPKANVWVLCEEAWMQNVDLARRQVSGLSLEQIGRAVSFEIEPFSGTPVGESVLGFREGEERDGVKSYWVAELPAKIRDGIQDLVAAAGGKLIGICHPGGVPSPIDPASAGQPWRRLEAWNGGMVWMESDEKQQVRTKVLTGLPSVRQSSPGSSLELLSAGMSAPLPNPDPAAIAKRFDLDNEGHLRPWLSAWAALFRSGKALVPVIPPRPPKPTLRKHIVTGVALEAAMILIFLIVIWHGTSVRNRLRKERAEIGHVNDKIQAVTKENAALRKEVADLDLQAQKRALLARQRTALPAILRALASTRPDDIVLSGIHPGGATALIVDGIALDALSVDEMSIALNTSLRRDGWLAQPLRKTAKGTAGDSGPWEFSISVSQDEPAPPVAPVAHRR